MQELTSSHYGEPKTQSHQHVSYTAEEIDEMYLKILRGSNVRWIDELADVQKKQDSCRFCGEIIN